MTTAIEGSVSDLLAKQQLPPWVGRKERDRAVEKGLEVPPLPMAGYCSSCVRWRVTRDGVAACNVCGRPTKAFGGAADFPNELSYQLMDLILKLQMYCEEEPEVMEAMNPRYLTDEGSGSHRQKIQVLMGIASRKGIATSGSARPPGSQVLFQDQDGLWWKGWKTGEHIEVLGRVATPAEVAMVSAAVSVPVVPQAVPDDASVIRCDRCGKTFENQKKLGGHKITCKGGDLEF